MGGPQYLVRGCVELRRSPKGVYCERGVWFGAGLLACTAWYPKRVHGTRCSRHSCMEREEWLGTIVHTRLDDK